MNDVQLQARQLPAANQVAPRPSNLGTLDLSGARLFAKDTAWHTQLLTLFSGEAKEVRVTLPCGREILALAALRALLRSFHIIHGVWRQVDPVLPTVLNGYTEAIDTFSSCWRAFHWKPTVWVHWMVCHSAFFLRTYGNLSWFSSVPTERRHQGFKRDLRHSFQGFKLSDPRRSPKCLTHALDMDALDKGLQLAGAPVHKRARLH